MKGTTFLSKKACLLPGQRVSAFDHFRLIYLNILSLNFKQDCHDAVRPWVLISHSAGKNSSVGANKIKSGQKKNGANTIESGHGQLS